MKFIHSSEWKCKVSIKKCFGKHKITYKKEVLKINWSKLENINKWLISNRPQYISHETKTLKNNKKFERYVLINYSLNPIKEGWWEKWDIVKRGFNCDYNRRKNKNYTTQTYQETLWESKSDINLIGEFTNIKDKHTFYCKIHKKEFISTADGCLHKAYGCPICALENKSKNLRKSHISFVKEVEDKFKGEFEVLDEYQTQDIKIRFKHTKCENVFSTTPNKLLQGRGCDYCSQSFGERIISNYLIENKIDFEPEKKFKGCKDKKLLRFDFYLPSLNICIEFDGKQHFTVNNKFDGLEGYVNLRRRDVIKNEYCQNNNIKLIRIPYWNLRKVTEILIDNDIA